MKAQTAVKKTAEKAVGTSKGGKNTKIHTLVDGLGNPLAFLLSSGNDHDSVHAIPLLKKFEIAGSNILGDKAYPELFTPSPGNRLNTGKTLIKSKNGLSPKR